MRHVLIVIFPFALQSRQRVSRDMTVMIPHFASRCPHKNIERDSTGAISAAEIIQARGREFERETFNDGIGDLFGE
jgi:hypothetical protein